MFPTLSKTPIFSAVAGLIFFATPFEGSDTLVESTAKSLGIQPSSKKLSDLTSGSRKLQRTRDDFNENVLQKRAFRYVGVEAAEKKKRTKTKGRKKKSRNVVPKKAKEHNGRFLIL